ncbi:MAG TPA: autotransporter-associated beta strand repeat-containing protein [Tepidisphaeraceae bacterium]|nr:autotransporter-associated beta strand repeat-containing protein [Tepidisphaeraceae bacterium]
MQRIKMSRRAARANFSKSRRMIAGAAFAAAPLLASPMLFAAAPAGVFSSFNYTAASNMTDTNVSLNSNYTYQEAANINGGALTINGVNFATGGLTSGTSNGSTWAIGGTGTITSYTANTTANGNNNIATTNQLYTMETTFSYNGKPAIFTLNGLTAGTVYSLTYYDSSFGTPGTRVMSSITSSDGGSISNYDENGSGDGVGSLLRYTFVATGASEALTFNPVNSNTFQFYGFSNEQVFTNTFTSSSGSNWSTAAYSIPALAPTAGAGGTNVIFPTGGSLQTVNLDVNETVGHIQFNSANGWTISSSSASTLTLQGDVGGVSVLDATAGTNTISVPLTFNNNVVKYGAGSIVFTNNITSNGNSLTIGSDGGVQFGDGATTNGATDGPIVNNGALTFANFTPQSYGSATAVISGTGNLVQSGPAALTLTGSNTFTGTTTVSGSGGIILANGNALSGSTVAVSPQITFSPLSVDSYTFGGLTGSGALSLADTSSAPIALTIGTNNLNATYSGNITGASASSLTKLGTGTQILSGSNAGFAGTTAINGGVLEAAQTISLSGYTTPGQISVGAAGTLAVEVGPAGTPSYFQPSDITSILANVTFAPGATIGIDTTNATGGVFTYAPGIAINGSLLKLGAGTLQLGGTNSYSGNTAIQNGTLQFLGSGSFTGTAGALTLGSSTNSGVLILGDSSGPVNATFTSLTVSGTGTASAVVGGSSSISTLTINNAAADTYSGTLGGTGTQNNLALTKGGAGTLTLPGAYGFVGPTTINAGVMVISSLQAGGTASGIGAATNAAGNLVFGGGTLQYVGSAAASTDRLFTLAGSGTIDSSGGGAVNFSNTGTIATSGTAAPTLTLQGSNTGSNTFAGLLPDNGTNITSLTKSGGGTWFITGTASTFTGVTTINSGILNVASLANYGSASSIGARLASQEVAQNVGIHFAGGTLQYTGSTPQTTNRQIRVSTAGGTIDASGSSPTATLTFNFNGVNTDFFDTAGTRTLTFTGSNTGPNTFDQTITDQAASPTTVNKTGFGTWILGGNMAAGSGGSNGYTGGTNVQNGTLALASTGTMNPLGALTLGSGTTSGVFEIGDATGAGTATFSNLAVSGIGASNSIISGSSSSAISTLTINNAAANSFYGTIGGPGANQNNLGLTKSGAGTLTLNNASTYVGPTIIQGGTLKLQLPQVAAASVATVNSYTFTNGVTNLISGENPTANTNGSGGTESSGAVGVLTDNAMGPLTGAVNTARYTIGNNASLTYSLGSSATGYSLNAVQLYSVWNDSGRSQITLSNISYSTVAAPSTFITLPSTGINYAPGNGTGLATITAPGGFLINNAADIQFNFGGQENNYVGYGELQVFGTPTPTSILPSATPVQLATGATLDLAGTTQTIASLADATAGSTGSVINSAAAVPATLTINPASGTTTFSGSISDNGTANAISVVKSGAGTQVLAGASTFSGTTSVNGGPLIIAGSLPAGGTVLVAANATLGGSGSVGAITAGPSSAGLIAPAFGAPKILTAPTVAGGTALQFAFQLTQPDNSSANYGNSAAPANDVLHLTGSQAIGNGGLTSGNIVSIYLPAGLSAGNTFKGAFYADSDTNLGNEISAATYVFYEGSSVGGGDATTYDGTTYKPIADFGLTVSTSAVPESAAFASGTVNGTVAQFTVSSVPEPGALSLLALGGLGLLARRRRMCGK